MKKAPFLLTIILLSLVAKPAHAATTTILDGGNWWSIKDLALYYNQKNATREASCFDDVACHDEILASDLLDAKYSAARKIFYNKRFAISSINRETSDVEVYYNNDDIDVSKYNPGWRDSDLKMMYIGWFEESPGQIFSLPDDSIETGSGQHTLVSQKNSTGLFPSQAFMSFGYSGSLSENTSGLIGYAIKSSFFAGRELIDISMCLNNPNWISCDLYVSEAGEAKYFPTVNIDEPGPDMSPEITDPPFEAVEDPFIPDEPFIPEDPSILDEPFIEPPVPDDPIISKDPAPEETPALETTSTLENFVSYTPIISQIGAPSLSPAENQIESSETGNETSKVDVPITSSTTTTAKKCSKAECPWWFIVLVLAGDVVILWFFLPKSKKVQ